MLVILLIHCMHVLCNIYYVDGHVLSSAINYLSNTYIESRYNSSPDEWPPYHPKHYTTLALIHHEGRHTDTKVISQELASEGMLPGSYSGPKTEGGYKSFTINISGLFSYSMKVSSGSTFILIEGTPGIGKTVLSKEIAHQWAIGKLLNISQKLVFLLYLCDPNLKDICLIKD